MTTILRRSVRSTVLLLLATCLAACHFHGHHCHGWRPHFHVPVRHCR